MGDFFGSPGGGGFGSSGFGGPGFSDPMSGGGFGDPTAGGTFDPSSGYMGPGGQDYMGGGNPGNVYSSGDTAWGGPPGGQTTDPNITVPESQAPTPGTSPTAEGGTRSETSGGQQTSPQLQKVYDQLSKITQQGGRNLAPSLQQVSSEAPKVAQGQWPTGPQQPQQQSDQQQTATAGQAARYPSAGAQDTSQRIAEGQQAGTAGLAQRYPPTGPPQPDQQPPAQPTGQEQRYPPTGPPAADTTATPPLTDRATPDTTGGQQGPGYGPANPFQVITGILKGILTGDWSGLSPGIGDIAGAPVGPYGGQGMPPRNFPYQNYPWAPGYGPGTPGGTRVAPGTPLPSSTGQPPQAQKPQTDEQRQAQIRQQDLPQGGNYVIGDDGKPMRVQTDAQGNPQYDAQGKPIPAPQGIQQHESASGPGTPAGQGTTPPPQGVTDYSGQSGLRAHGQMQQVRGMVVHHTGPGIRTPQELANTLRQRGLGVQYFVDRNGQTYRMMPEGQVAWHTKNGGTGTIGQRGAGYNNGNMEGVEVAAANDRDVTPAQRQAVANLIGQRAQKFGYNPQQSVFGHGELNSDKERDEGMSTVSGIRNGTLRANLEGQGPQPTPQGPAPQQPPVQQGRMTRGDRNRNPGNIKGGPYPGQTGTDPQGHAIFDTPENGWRAQGQLLQRKYNNETVPQMSRYANHDQQWVRNVMKFGGFGPNQKLDLNNPETLDRLQRAISQAEGTRVPAGIGRPGQPSQPAVPAGQERIRGLDLLRGNQAMDGGRPIQLASSAESDVGLGAPRDPRNNPGQVIPGGGSGATTEDYYRANYPDVYTTMGNVPTDFSRLEAGTPPPTGGFEDRRGINSTFAAQPNDPRVQQFFPRMTAEREAYAKSQGRIGTFNPNDPMASSMMGRDPATLPKNVLANASPAEKEQLRAAGVNVGDQPSGKSGRTTGKDLLRKGQPKQTAAEKKQIRDFLKELQRQRENPTGPAG